jgi:hypothetical protein
LDYHELPIIFGNALHRLFFAGSSEGSILWTAKNTSGTASEL